MGSPVSSTQALRKQALPGALVTAFLLCLVFPHLSMAQVRANIWHADTAWYDAQLSEYQPFDIPVRVSVRNDGAEAVRDVRLLVFSQEALMFKDKQLTTTRDAATLLGPGDSVVVLLEMQQNIRRSAGRLRYVPQVYWILEWKEDTAATVHASEGHGTAMNIGGCPFVLMYKDIVTELTLPDTLLLDTGDVFSGHHVLEVPCRLYSTVGRPLRLKDVILEVEGETIFRKRVQVERVLPTGSLDSLPVLDTLHLLFRVSIPLSLVSTDLLFRIEPGIYLDSACAYQVLIDAGRRYPVQVRHPSKRGIAFTATVTDIGSRGPEMHLRIGSWCGTAPLALGSRSFDIIDSGEPVDILRSNMQEYNTTDTPLRIVFAVDLTGSMGAGSALAAAKELVLQASRTMVPGQDSLILYTLTDHARHHPGASESHAALVDVLDSLRVTDGAEVFNALDEAMEMEIRTPHEGEVLMYFVTDGWQPYAYDSLRPILQKGEREGFHVHTVAPGLDFNTEVMHEVYLPRDIDYDMIRWRTSKHRYSWGFLSYPISCARGVDREFTFTVHDWCGTDTVLTGAYQLPDLQNPPTGLRLSVDDVQVTSGQSFAVTYSYAIPKTFTWRRTEFVLEYDTLLLRLDSIGMTGLWPGGFWKLEVEPGRVHFEYSMDNVTGSGTMAPFHFTAITVADTVRTFIRCTPWARYDQCIPGFPSEVRVTALPHGTAVEPVPQVHGFEILDLFPQPATDILTLQYRSDISVTQTACIMDLLGRLIWQGELPRMMPGVQEFNITLPSSLTSGMYMLLIRPSVPREREGTMAARRFVLHR